MGPIANTAQDAAIVMKYVSQNDEEDPLSIHSPPLQLAELSKECNLSGIKIGIYDEWCVPAMRAPT